MRSDTPYKTIEDVRTTKEAAEMRRHRRHRPRIPISRSFCKKRSARNFKLSPAIPAARRFLILPSSAVRSIAAHLPSKHFSAESPITPGAENRLCPSPVSERQQARRARLPNTPTIFELMDRYKTADAGRVSLRSCSAPTTWAGPTFGPPGMPADRLKTLRDGFAETMANQQFRCRGEKSELRIRPGGRRRIGTTGKRSRRSTRRDHRSIEEGLKKMIRLTRCEPDK